MVKFSRFRNSTEDSKFSLRRLFPVTIVTSGTFAWWFLLTLYFEDIYNFLVVDQSWIFVLAAIFYGSGAISAIPGSMIGERINQKKFLFFYFTFGVLATALLAVQQNLVSALISSALLGVSLGLGFPSCLAMLSDCTSSAERARFSGTIVLETFIMVFLGMVILEIFDLGIIGIVAVAIVLRSMSYIGISSGFCEKPKEKSPSWLSILTSRQLVLYLFPWLAFNLAGELVGLIWDWFRSAEAYSILQAYDNGNILRMAAIAFLGPMIGIIADRRGRKPPILFALVILGFSFSFLGLATSELSVFVYMVISGIAWSLLMVSYFALFGDIASSKAAGKYYALGISTPLVAYALVRGILPSLNITTAEASVLSPILGILLFMSIIPVLYAKETLPEKTIKERKLREHLKKMEKIVTESKKNQ